MKIQYFADTDTVYLRLNEKPVFETKDLDENTVIDIDARGNLVAITIEHAKERADISNFVYEQIAVPATVAK
ncbi:MAG: DUF2283 domain-containing protein [Chloroflexi bacterium]|nr:DUF2283 domain-containing protein [Chloroflexota bacterium]